MKAKFEFDLPEENETYKMYRQAPDMHCALYDLYLHLRSKTKYEQDSMTPEEYQVWENVYQLFWDTLKDNNVEVI